MRQLKITLPDGTVATRTTRHAYDWVCAFQITDLKDLENTTKAGRVSGWGAQWSQTKTGAAAQARRWHNGKLVKAGYQSVETRLLKV